MDGHSRAKLVKAGYKIFRMRDLHPVQAKGPVKLQIREMSHGKEWALFGEYSTKASRERAWKELAKDDKHLMEHGPEGDL